MSEIESKIASILSELRGLMKTIEVELSKPAKYVNKRDLEYSLERVLVLLSSLKESLETHTKELESRAQASFFQKIFSLSLQEKTKPPPNEFFNTFRLTQVPKVPEKDIEHVCSVIELILTVMSHEEEKVLPSYLREEIRGVLRDLSALLTYVETNYEISISPIDLIPELIGMIESKWGLDEKWAVAVCYLSTLEVVLNKVIKQLEIQGNVEKLSFKDKVSYVLDALEKMGVEVKDILLKKLPDDLWDLRNKVIHAGYTPSDKELTIITNAVKEILTTLAKATKSSIGKPNN